MSDGDVTLVRDEDVLRRMWQQTEDFSRKKEIRAHMYRLREERLRNLYSPEPSGDGKGCEFPAQGHVKSFADQSFQSMKSKEVRDAGSPPKEFTYRGQDLKALSNAGWNVEQENRTTDDGHTHIKSVNANIEGRYDVEGGKGQFTAEDHHKEAITEYHDENSSLKQNKTSSNTAAHEHVVRQTDDGTHSSLTTSSSTSTSKFQQVSSSKHDTVPNITNNDYDPRYYDCDTNRNEQVTRRDITKNNDYEQNLRNDFNSGDLVSRKVEYPDDNTKVIVETRCLPDGTRVTSTKREFRAPVQSRSEYYQTQENKSYTNQQKSDTQESSSKVTKNLVDDRTTDIVDSQRKFAEHDFKRQLADYTAVDHSNSDLSQTHRYETKTNKMTESNDNDEYTKTIIRDQRRNNDDREVITRRDDTNQTKQQYDHQEVLIKCDNRTTIQKDYKETQRQNAEQKIHDTNTDKQVEKIIEKKTTDYQTTYNVDYNQKKISNDWSASHQAWASTLRADTPSTTRPSTRASSPGSRTFKSSTSSLRSSVSPDKTNRKPLSRGGSPNKVDRYSPTRTVSEKHSSTHSAHSVTEVKSPKYSEVQRPPTGRSPTRPGYSPERKAHDYRQRLSVSPEKKPHNLSNVPNSSPDRKSQDTSPTESPKTKSPTRPIDQRQAHTGHRESPDRKKGYQPTADYDSSYPDNTSANKSNYPKGSSPTRGRQSPDKKPGTQKPTNSRPSPTEDFPRTTSPPQLHQPADNGKRSHMSPDRKPVYSTQAKLDRSGTSPDKKPDYMKPTDVNKPTVPNFPDENDVINHSYVSNLDRDSQSYNKTTTHIQKDHYKFIDEETKMYTKPEKQDTLTKDSSTHRVKHDQTPSPKNKSSNKDTPDFRAYVPTQKDRSPSPNDFIHLQGDTQVKKNEVVTQRNDYTQRIMKKHQILKEKDSQNEKNILREPSPSKYGTYDKKQPFDGICDVPSKNDKNDLSPHREKPTKKPLDQPSLSAKTSPRDSTSPIKSSKKDEKHKSTTDFITTERTIEETNKKTTKDRPRQLVTPSSSPTRKPTTTETEPSTGQSSPTTSVSGFVYFSSPRKVKSEATDLDEQETFANVHTDEQASTVYRKPESLDVKRSPSPSKIPCRSPSPDKGIIPSKESLPRKSSLKKPFDASQSSPTETPPSNFRVSPEEPKEVPGQKLVIKDHSNKPEANTPGKPKPPLERRETYEDRCRKILGMAEDTTTSGTATKEMKYSKEPQTNPTSLSLSSSRSPLLKENKFDVSDFITGEKENLIKSSTPHHNDILITKTPKNPRETSPNRRQDIIVKNNTTSTTTEDIDIKNRQCSERNTINESKSTMKDDTLNPRFPTSTSQSPERIVVQRIDGTDYLRNSPSKCSDSSLRDSLSPERRPRYKSPEKEPGVIYPKEPSPKKTCGVITSETNEYSSLPDQDLKETFFATKTQLSSRRLDSPPKASNDKPAKSSYSPERSPERKPGSDRQTPVRVTPEEKLSKTYPREPSPTKPGFMKTTESVTSKLDANIKKVKETKTKIVDHKHIDRSLELKTSKILEPVDDTLTDSSSSPKRKHEHPSSTCSNSLKEPKDRYPNESHSKPVDVRTTVSATEKIDTTTVTNKIDTTEEVEEIKTRYLETKKTHCSIESPTRKIIEPADTSTDNEISTLRSSTRKESVEKIPSESETPGYMRTTTSVTSKFDSVTESNETVVSDKHKIKHKNSRPLESPSSKLKISDESPSRLHSLHSSNRKPGHEDFPTELPATCTTTELNSNTKPEEKYSVKSSPSTVPKKPLSGHSNPIEKSSEPKRQQSEIPSYMKATESTINKHEATIEQYDETFSSRSVNSKYPETDSLDKNPHSMVSHKTELSKHSLLRSSVSPDGISSKLTRDTPSKKPGDKYPEKTPGYVKSTTTISSKYDDTYTEDITTPENRHSSPRSSVSPSRRTSSPRKSIEPHSGSSNRRPGYQSSPRSSPERKPSDKLSQETCTKLETDRTLENTRKISSVTSKNENKKDTHKSVASKTTKSETIEDGKVTKTVDSRNIKYERTPSPPKLHSTEIKRIPEPKPDYAPLSTEKNTNKPNSQLPNDSSPIRSSTNVEKKPTSIKPTSSMTSKYESRKTIEEINDNTRFVEEKYSSPRSSVSPSKHILDKPSATKPKNKDEPSETKTIEEPRQLRTPSPTKKSTKVTEISSDFIMLEREQEILDKVKTSLRKLSPERKEKSPSRERSPGKTTTSLQDLEITTHTIKDNEYTIDGVSDINDTNITPKINVTRLDKPKDEKPNDHKASSKPPSRHVSPIKKASGITSPTKIDKGLETPGTPRSLSPRKPLSPTEGPQSPKTSGIKPKESSHLTRKQTPATLATTIITAPDVKKSTGTSTIVKQTTSTKISSLKSTTKRPQSPSSKEPETKRAPTTKLTKDTSKKETDTKVIRTASDVSIKPKKTSPQRIKSKPEIQISNISTKTSPRTPKSTTKEPYAKLPSKSATTLNTSIDDDDVIIDMELSKSSRENSPDRICPTPVNFGDDVGTPRFPDEVREPDDEFRKRTHHIIHETESIVDDIVEICEDDELFVRKTYSDISGDDESLLSVTDKVNKFTIGIDTKPNDSTTTFKDTDRRVFSDHTEENLKSDECLLSVSEKVNKFAKGSRHTKDKSPSRNVTDEYDKNTTYQDSYTKLSVHDKAHLFVETAENMKTPKAKPTPHKVQRQDLSNVDDSLRSDDCLLSVSDKVSKFIKTAEHFITETQENEDNDKRIKVEHDKILKKIVDDVNDEIHKDKAISPDDTTDVNDVENPRIKTSNHGNIKSGLVKDTTPSHGKNKNIPELKPITTRVPAVKITTLRSSEAVKKAKALFENISSVTHTTKESTGKTTKLTDIGVVKSKPDTNTNISSLSVEDVSNLTDAKIGGETTQHVREVASNEIPKRHIQPRHEKSQSNPCRESIKSPEVLRSKSPARHLVENISKTVLTKQPATQISESPRQLSENDRTEKVPGYLRSTKTSQSKEEPKFEDNEVSNRRGSGKFGVELRRTSVERLTVSSERRRSVEHPCIEDIYDLDLLEQMLEKVIGYEQRRRIRAQIRVARKKIDTEHVVDTNTYTKNKRIITQTIKSPERQQTRSPERTPKSHQKTLSPDRQSKTPQRSIPEQHQQKEHPALNTHSKEISKTLTDKRQRPHSPEKPATKPIAKTKSPARHVSPEKKTRTQSPTKASTLKPKPNRFNEYASAYMKKVGLNEADKVKISENKAKKVTDDKNKSVKHVEEHRTFRTVEEHTTTKSYTERTSSKDVIDVTHVNGECPLSETRLSPERKPQSPERRVHSSDRKVYSPDRKRKSLSPERRGHSPERKVHSLDRDRKALSPERKSHSPDRKIHSPECKVQNPERLYQRTPSPEFKRQKADAGKTLHKETIIKTVYDIEKKIPQKPVQEEKPSWVTNRNLKKITSEARTFSSKKIEEKPKYRASSPSKVIAKPIDVITSSYGPGPLDADGKPIFGIRALRNGGSNFQVKGTVIRQEYHSRNGGEPEGTVSVTAYSTEPEDLERLLQNQSEPPSRIHGLAAITTTKKFGRGTGTTLKEVHGKDERAAIDQFTHSDRRVVNSKIEDLTEHTFETQEVAGDTVHVLNRQENTIRDKRDQDQKLVKVQKVTQRKGQKMDTKERVERTEDKKTVRQSSVKSLTEKYIKSANETSKTDRSAYPKAGLILRTSTMKDSVSSDSSAHAGLTRTDSNHSLASMEDTVVTTTSEQCDGGLRTVTTTTRSGHVKREERSFLDSSAKVTGVQDILTRMKNADIVIQEGDTTEDAEARALLNKFLGATVLMAGMQGYVSEKPSGKVTVNQETVRTTNAGGKVSTSQSRTVEETDIDQCWDERVLRQLLDECTDYEQRRRLRARIRTLMAEQEACASAVTEALAAAGEATDGGDGSETREEEEVTVTSSVRRNSSEKTVSSSTTTTKTSKVIESMTGTAPKPVSPFAKFRQLEKQNSTNSPNSPKSPQSPGSPSQPYFKFTDPALQASAATIKERLLQWCRDKTRDYENVKLENFSTSWADGLAFCALVHHFLPKAFDYSQLTPDKRRHNFTLAFKIADEKAGIYPLLDVDDMVTMRKPDWKCVFTYVQSIHRRFKDQD